MAEKIVAGIALNERPEAQIWSFMDRGTVKRVRTIAYPDEEHEVDFSGNDVSEVVNRIMQSFLAEIFAFGHVDAIGISSPGNIDRSLFKISNIARVGVQSEIDVGLGFAEYKYTSTRIENDVTCLAIAANYLDYKYHSDPLVYIYAERGINIGVISGGEPLCGMLHPEIGHFTPDIHLIFPSIFSKKDKSRMSTCDFHKGCLEALISRPALEAMWPGNSQNIIDKRPNYQKEHEMVAYCISKLCEISTLVLAPRKIILGGYFGRVLRDSIINTFARNMRDYPVYKDRQNRAFIELSPYEPNRLFALGAAIRAYHDVK